MAIPGIRVAVYWNLHRDLYSVKALDGPNKGLVISREREVLLRFVKPRVSEAGRQRVLREEAKNVHAFLTGIWTHEIEIEDETEITHVRYNPYDLPCFVSVDESGTESRLILASGAKLSIVEGRPHITAFDPVTSDVLVPVEV